VLTISNPINLNVRFKVGLSSNAATGILKTTLNNTPSMLLASRNATIKTDIKNIDIPAIKPNIHKYA